jgi:hypothetical protein
MIGRKDRPVAQKELRRVRAAANRVSKAEQDLHDAILAAVESGESYRDIAPHAGLSYSRVYQIAQKRKAAGG